MTTLAAFSASLITDSGRAIAARVTAMVDRAGLPIEDALAVAAELGIQHGRAEGVDIVHARLSNQARYGELPK